jgi:hypothetical protein
MSIFNPETAEDRMAIVPLVGCVLPLCLAVVALVVWLL